MKVWEITTPDGRKVRHVAEAAAEAQAKLMPGYTVTAEVLGAGADMSGGYVIPVGGRSLLAELLDRHGDDMLAWLSARGIKGKP